MSPCAWACLRIHCAGTSANLVGRVDPIMTAIFGLELTITSYMVRDSAHGYCSGRRRCREMSPGPVGKLRRLLAGNFVGQRDRVTRIRAEIRVGFEVSKHCCDTLRLGEPARKNLAWDPLE